MKPKKTYPRKTKQLCRVKLDTLGNVAAEMAKIYRQMRHNTLDHDKGKNLVWVLSALRSALEAQAIERIEERLLQLEGGNNAKVINGHGHLLADSEIERSH